MPEQRPDRELHLLTGAAIDGLTASDRERFTRSATVRICLDDRRVQDAMSNFGHRLRFMRDHRWAPGHMSAYLDAELASRARARLDRHVEECAECRGLLRSLRRMLGLLQALPQALTPPGGPQEIAAAVRRRLHEPTGSTEERVDGA
jgi:Putative zinc-finger